MDLTGVRFALCLLFLIHSSLQQSTPKRKSQRKDSATASEIEELQKKVEEISKELLLLKEQQALQTVCLKGVKVHGKCFLADAEMKPFHTASEDCISKGGILSTPASSQENDQLAEYAEKSIGPGAKIWLGVNDMTTEGRWLDLTGSDPTYTNWAKKPDSDPSKNCAVLSSASEGKWSEESCRADGAFVCEFNIV